MSGKNILLIKLSNHACGKSMKLRYPKCVTFAHSVGIACTEYSSHVQGVYIWVWSKAEETKFEACMNEGWQCRGYEVTL